VLESPIRAESTWHLNIDKFMRHAAWVIAYHGCDRKVGELILSGKNEINLSTNQFDWLGTGSYFWENSYSRALHWANFLKDNPGSSKTRIKVPFVVGAIIDPGNCLDLSEDSSLRILKAAYDKFKETISRAKLQMPKNEPSHTEDRDLVKRKLDCAVINFLHRIRLGKSEPFDSVRGPFMEGTPLFLGSKIHSKTHLQWCVCNPKKSILGYFRPKRPN
jgi:hypothetical protein